MNTQNNPGSSYAITVDISEALRNLENLANRIEGMGKHIERNATQSANGIDNLNGKLQSLVATLGIGFGLNELKGFASEIINVRTEMEGYELSLESMLKSKDKAGAMLATFKEMAATTPLTLGALASSAKMMLGFGLASESVIPYLKAIGDISGGSADKFGSLTLAFSQMSSVGKLMGQDLLQMINAGFNPLEEISRKTGKSIGVLKEEMSKGAITSKMVQDAFISVTQEGGRFNGMLEKQGQGLLGLQAQLRGAWETMLDDLGKGQEGFIRDGYKIATSIVNNYQQVGKVIAGIVVAVGAYKAALIACNVVESVSITLKTAQAIAMRAQALGLSGVTTATILARNATASLNATLLANPYVLVASLIATLAVGAYALATAKSEAQRAEESFNETLREQASAIEEADGKAQNLLNTIRNSNNTNYQRQKAFESLIKIYPSLIGQVNAETLALMDQAEALKLLNRLKDKKTIEDKKKNLDRLKAEATAERLQNERAQNPSTPPIDFSGAGANWRGADTPQYSTQKQKELALAQADYDKTAREIEWANKTKEEKIATLEKENAERAKKIKYTEAAQNKTKTERDKKALQWRIDKLKEEQALKDQELTLLKTPPKSEDPNKNKDKKPKGKSPEEIAKEQEQARRAIIDEEFKLEEEYLSRQKDSTEKKLALLALAHRKTITQIERERQDLKRNKQADAKIIDEQAELKAKSAEESYNYEHSKIEAEDLKRKTETMREYLKLYGSYEQRRKAIIDEAKAKSEGDTTEGERLSIQAKLRIDLTELDKSYGVITSTITRLFGDLQGKGKDALKALYAEAQDLMRYLQQGQWHDEGGGVDRFGLSITEFEQNSRNPEKLKALSDQIDKIKAKALEGSNAFEKMTASLNELFKAGGDQLKMQEALTKVQSSISEISNVVGFLSDSFSSLGESLGSNVLSGIGDALSTMNNVVSKTMEGAKAGAMFGPIGAAAGAAVGAISSVASAISRAHDARHERRIQALANQIQGLEKRYKSLGKTLNDSYSADASKLIDQQNQILRQKQQLLRLQMLEERGKKKTDWGKVKQWQDEIENINDLIADNQQKAKDAIFGNTIQSAISDFASAYAEAWGAGNSRAEASRDFVKKQIKLMINETIKAASSKPMQAIRDKLTDFFRDGILSAQEGEVVQQMAEDLQRELDRKVGDNAQWLQSDSNLRGSSGKGFQAMSQDTGNELNGRFTAIQQDVHTISSIFADVKAINLNCLGHLADINRNTKELFEMNTRLANIEKNTRALR